VSELYDSHSHLDYEPLARQLEAVIGRAGSAGITHVLVPGVDPRQWARAEALRLAAASLPTKLRFGAGLHPQVLHELDAGALTRALDAMPEWIERLDAVAIGELGWDAGFARRSGPSLDEQSRVADLQIEIAKASKLPIILHVIDAHGLALERLARHAPLRGVIHSYSGSAELVREYVALGLSISMGPSVTWSRAKKPREAAAAIPNERLLVETDSPDQYPEGKASREGEIADLTSVIDAVARARDQSAEAIGRITFENAARLFA
jgi:TatD DNase family protein